MFIHWETAASEINNIITDNQDTIFLRQSEVKKPKAPETGKKLKAHLAFAEKVAKFQMSS